MRRKRIVICVAQIPFVSGGAEVLVDSLEQHLSQAGHMVEVVRVPCKCYPHEELLKSYLAWRLLDLTESEGQQIDLVIATKFPSYAVRHPNKVTWLVHQFRQAYDLYGTSFSGFGDNPTDQRVREIVRTMDAVTIGESRSVYAISRNVAARLAKYNGLEAEPLYPPPKHGDLYYNDGYGGYVLSVARLNATKRVHLLIEAMACTSSGLRCVVVGEGPEQEGLEKLVRTRHLEHRIEFLGRVEDSALLELYARSTAVFYAPYDEDYGYVTVEAFKSRKPVITAADSGGVLEFVANEENGYVCATNDPKQIADKLDQLFAKPELCRSMGEAGYEKVARINWDTVISRLTEEC